MGVEETFKYLKPFCIEVANMPTFKSIAQLHRALQNLGGGALNEKTMVEYVVFPLKLAIQRVDKKNENLQIKTLECMSFVFENVNVTSEALLVDILDVSCMLLSSMKHPGGKEMIALISEELKLNVTICLSKLLENSPIATLMCLFSEKMLPRLGHAVSLFLALVEFEMERNLRVNALKCLGFLSLTHKNVNEQQLQTISNMFCSFIPGISLSICRTLTDSSNLGQNIITCAVETLRDFVVLVLSDSRFDFIKNEVSKDDLIKKLAAIQAIANPQKEPNSTQTSKNGAKAISIKRSEEWMKLTASNIGILIERVIPRVAYNSNVKVRLAVISFAESVLKECHTSMKSSTPILIETLAALHHDEHQDVVTAAELAICAVRSTIEKGGDSLLVIVEEKLYERLLSLPRIMRGTSDEQKLLHLNVIAGYFMLLGNKMSKLLNSLVMLEKIVKSFIQILELDTTDIKIVEEKSLISEDLIKQAHSVAKSDIETHRFKNFKDVKIYLAIRKICLSIGMFSDLEIITDYLLEKFTNTTNQRKEIVLLLNEILRAKVNFEDIKGSKETPENSKGDQTMPYSSIIDQIISTFLREEFWFLPTSNITDVSQSQRDVMEDHLSLMRLEERKELVFWEKGIVIDQINSNIQLICLMINAISVCSCVLKRNFDVYLIKVLYPILEKLGNENAQIATTAYNALNIISNNCGEKSVADLLLHNADYLVNSVSLSFRHLTLFSSAPCVLSVMLTHSSVEILPMVADVMQDVFQCLDAYQEEVTFSLMKVLKSFASAVNIWFGNDHCDENSKRESVRKMDFNTLLRPRELREFLVDYCKLKLDARGEFNHTTEDTSENVEETADDDITEASKDAAGKKEKIPVHFQSTLTALEKCQHFLPSKDIRLKLLILDVIETSVLALKNRQNDLLPAIHKLWPPIIERMRDSNQIVASRTLEVICTMIDCSDDFLRQRIKKDVLPYAVDHLNRQYTASLKSNKLYRFSPSCKLQKKLISLLGNIIKNLGLPDEDMMKTIVATSKYLDCRQPEVLQMEACKALESAKKVDWNQTWLALSSLYSVKDLQSPGHFFKDIPFDEKVNKRNEYTDNIVKILYDKSKCTR